MHSTYSLHKHTIKENVHKIFTHGNVCLLVCSRVLLLAIHPTYTLVVHALGAWGGRFPNKSDSIVADLIRDTLLMELSPLCVSQKEKSASLTLVKNTNGCLVHFPHLYNRFSLVWVEDPPFVDFEISDVIYCRKK